MVTSGELVSSGFSGCLTAADSRLPVYSHLPVRRPSTGVVNMHLAAVGPSSE